MLAKILSFIARKLFHAKFLHKSVYMLDNGEEVIYKLYEVPYLYPKWAAGLTIGDSIFVRSDMLGSYYFRYLLRHEVEHVRQYKRYGDAFFFIYAFDFIKGLIKYRNTFKAYENILFEREAKEAERGYD